MTPAYTLLPHGSGVARVDMYPDPRETHGLRGQSHHSKPWITQVKSLWLDKGDGDEIRDGDGETMGCRVVSVRH